MTIDEALAELEALGTAQNRKVYARHGVPEPMFGVSMANLDKLAKKVGRDHELARGLWASGNHDARMLATRIADAETMTRSELDAWARDADSYVLTDSFSGLVGRSPHAESRMRKWTRSKHEFVGQAGWNVLAGLAMRDSDAADTELEARIEEIEERIHAAPNRVRHAMNQALIAIGIRNDGLKRKAVAAARRIGRVEVDHGETSCKTPDAEAYIEKTLAYRRKRAARAARR